MIMGSSAIIGAAEDLVKKARAVAAARLEVAETDVAFSAGEFRVAGTDLQMGWADIAAAGTPLVGAGAFVPPAPTFPNGCHVCEVEVDPETGHVQLQRYVSVEDIGRVMHPRLVEGQIHGGVVQGIGQSLLEEIRYDASGQLVTGSFMDYAMPRAADVPPIISVNLEVPTALNPLGVKGVGEAGTVGALAATTNAICNALVPAGVRHLDMPATPLRVWEALRDAGYGPAVR